MNENAIIKQYLPDRNIKEKIQWMKDYCAAVGWNPDEYLLKVEDGDVCSIVSNNCDAVHPNHYKLPNGMQVIDVEVAMLGKAAVQEHCLCTAVEYILRHKGKNGAEDIRKAHWWLSKWVELEDANEKATAT